MARRFTQEFLKSTIKTKRLRDDHLVMACQGCGGDLPLQPVWFEGFPFCSSACLDSATEVTEFRSLGELLRTTTPAPA